MFSELLILDLDGCILDNINAAISSHSKSFQAFGITNVNDDEIATALSSCATLTIQNIASSHSSVERLISDKSTFELLLEENRRFLNQSPEPNVFPLMKHIIELLYKAHRPVAVVTSRTEESALTALKKSGLIDRLDHRLLIGRDSAPNLRGKPSSDMLDLAISRASVTSREHVSYIGDLRIDQAASQAADINFFSPGWSPFRQVGPNTGALELDTLLDFWVAGIVPTTSDVSTHIIGALKNKSLRCFVGSGFSLDAGLDDWSSLVERIVGRSERLSSRVDDLPAVVQGYVDMHGQLGKARILKTVEQAFERAQGTSAKHALLTHLDVGRIWTTNYDTLIEDSCQKECQVITEDSQFAYTHKRFQIVKLNGSVLSSYSDIVLSDSDFEFLNTQRKNLLNELLYDLTHNEMLFLGVGFSDPLFEKELLPALCEKARGTAMSPIHYCLVASDFEFDNKKAGLLKDAQIEVASLPSWGEVTSVLAELTWNSNHYVIAISGACDEEGVSEAEAKFLRELGRRLVELGLSLRTGSGPGISKYIAQGVADVASETAAEWHRNALTNYSRVLSPEDIVDGDLVLSSAGRRRLERLISPFGSIRFVESGKSETDKYDLMRKEMLHGVDACLAISGMNDPSLGSGYGNRGMRMEKDIAERSGIPYLCTPFMQGFARDEFNSRNVTDFEVYGQGHMAWKIRSIMAALATCENPSYAAKLTALSVAYACLAK